MTAGELKWEDVAVTSIVEVETYTGVGGVKKLLAVTYVYRDYAPRTVYLAPGPVTRERLLKAVAEDLKSISTPPSSRV